MHILFNTHILANNIKKNEFILLIKKINIYIKLVGLKTIYSTYTPQKEIKLNYINTQLKCINN